jgi:PhnB protein
MATMNPYLNFDGTAEAAFTFYKSVFGGEFLTIAKMTDAPGTENLPENEKNRIMHISLPIGNNLMLLASDIVPSMGHKLVEGNNVHICLSPESREEAERLFNGLSAGGVVEMPLADMFWGAYYGNFKDKFGINWMVNYDARERG